MAKIKICGITNREDYLHAVALGADYIGFIFFAESPRYVDLNRVKEILAGTRDKPAKVGVFVNESIKNVRRVVDQVGLDLVQLHGDESPEYCRDLSLPYWKALRVRDGASLTQLRLYPHGTFLLDAFVEGVYGGTGKSLNEGILRQAMVEGDRIIVAGGLSEKNIRHILKLRPFAVDVSSSLEERPGKKNRRKMERFFQHARSKEFADE